MSFDNNSQKSSLKIGKKIWILEMSAKTGPKCSFVRIEISFEKNGWIISAERPEKSRQLRRFVKKVQLFLRELWQQFSQQQAKNHSVEVLWKKYWILTSVKKFFCTQCSSWSIEISFESRNFEEKLCFFETFQILFHYAKSLCAQEKYKAIFASTSKNISLIKWKRIMKFWFV